MCGRGRAPLSVLHRANHLSSLIHKEVQVPQERISAPQTCTFCSVGRELASPSGPIRALRLICRRRHHPLPALYECAPRKCCPQKGESKLAACRASFKNVRTVTLPVLRSSQRGVVRISLIWHLQFDTRQTVRLASQDIATLMKSLQETHQTVSNPFVRVVVGQS